MKTNSTSLGSLLDDLADELSSQIKGPDCPAATLNVARQLLRDNGVTVDPHAPSKSMESLRDAVEGKDQSLPNLEGLPTTRPN